MKEAEVNNICDGKNKQMEASMWWWQKMTKAGDSRQVGASDDGENKQVEAMAMSKANGSMQVKACENGENKWEVGMCK